MKETSKELHALIWPVFFQMLMQMLVGNVDQIMVASYRQEAVGAIANANQILSMLLLTFSLVSMGTTILVSQNKGAGEERELQTIYTLSCAVNLVLGVLASVLLCMMDEALLNLMDVADAFMAEAKVYLRIVGGCCFLQALYSVFLAILRSNQMMKDGMIISLVMNVINVLGNAILIHGCGPIPALGIRGAAVSTVLSQFMGLMMLIYFFRHRLDGRIDLRCLKPFPTRLLWNLIRIGIPSGGETFSYNMTQIVLLRFINGFGPDAVLARSYCSSISSFSMLYCFAAAEVLQIKVGYYVGAEKYEAANRIVKEVVCSSVFVTLLLSLLVYLHIEQVVDALFHVSVSVTALCRTVMLIEVFRQFGRSFNLVFLRALQGAGDIRYVVMVGIIATWTIVVGGGCIMGCLMGMGLAGTWLALAMDDFVRGCIFARRWMSGVWKRYRFIQSASK